MYFSGMLGGMHYVDAHRPVVDYSSTSYHPITEDKLPDELKECKFYTVNTREGFSYNMVYCPTKNIHGINYREGKVTRTTIIATDPVTNEDQPVTITGSITQMNCKDKHCTIELDKD